MKLYYVAHCRFPSERAHAIQIAKMAEAMRLAGADVELIVPRRRQTRLPDWQGFGGQARRGDGTKSPREFYGLKTDLPVRYLPVIDLYQLGSFGYVLGGLSFLISYWVFLFLKKLRGERFMLYTIDMDEFSFIGVSLLGIPFAMEIHGSKEYGVLLNRMFAKARALLTINTIIKHSLVETFSLNADKVLVAPNGTDIDFFSNPGDRNAWRKRWQIPENAKLVLYIGKCYPWKGMEIFDEVARALPEVTFTFVGCTREELGQVTGKAFEHANALFFGQQPYMDMPAWMGSADILLVIGTKKNEYSYYQTSPMKLFEYLATGVPIIAPGTPAVRDMVSKNEVSFYEPDSADSLTQRIETLLTDPARARALAGAARTGAHRFSWDHRARMVLQMLGI